MGAIHFTISSFYPWCSFVIFRKLTPPQEQFVNQSPLRSSFSLSVKRHFKKKGEIYPWYWLCTTYHLQQQLFNNVQYLYSSLCFLRWRKISCRSVSVFPFRCPVQSVVPSWPAISTTWLSPVSNPSGHKHVCAFSLPPDSLYFSSCHCFLDRSSSFRSFALSQHLELQNDSPWICSTQSSSE